MPTKSRVSLIFFCIMFPLLFLSTVLSAINRKDPSVKRIAMLEIKEAITPATEKYVKRALKEAQEQQYDALLLVLDTPGGLLESTRNIVQSLLSADPIDTIVYVYPPGSRAGSAGVFITLSAKYAAMAPGCNIGAAHPVTIGEDNQEDEQGLGKMLKRALSKQTNQEKKQGSDNARHMAQKIENDTVAFIKSICQVRNRNEEWAVLAVKESVSITSEEALEKKVIDHVADNPSDLVKKIYGEGVSLQLFSLEKSWGERLLSVLANPNLMYYLFILGLTGIGVEIRNPGLIFPGVLGALCFIIGLYSSQVLPINYAGLILMVLAFVMFVMEVSVTSYGLLTIGGVISLIIGSAMLFDSPLEFFRVSPGVIASMVIPLAALLILALIFIVPALTRKSVSGREGLIGETGTALAPFREGKGRIRVHGEIWNAVSDFAVSRGDEVTVTQVNNLKLTVEKKK